MVVLGSSVFVMYCLASLVGRRERVRVGVGEWEALSEAQYRSGRSVSSVTVSRDLPSMVVPIGSWCAPKSTSRVWFVHILVASGRASKREQFLSLSRWKWEDVIFQKASRAGSGRKVSLTLYRSLARCSSVRKSFAFLEA